MFSSLLLDQLWIFFTYDSITYIYNWRDVKLNLPKPTIFKAFFIEWYISIRFLVIQYVNIVLNVHSLITKANHQTTTMSPTFFLSASCEVKIYRIFTDVSLSPNWKSSNLGIFSTFHLNVVQQIVDCSNFSRKKRLNPSESMCLESWEVAPNYSLSMNGV